MVITCFHPKSKNGLPVIINNDGEVIDYKEGLTEVLKELGWSRADFAREMGYNSSRSVEKFWQGTIPPANVLNMLEVALESPANQYADTSGRNILEEVEKAHSRAERLALNARLIINSALRAKFYAAAIVDQIKNHVYAHNKYLKPVLTPKEIKDYASLYEWHEKGYVVPTKDVLHRARILHRKPTRTSPRKPIEHEPLMPSEEWVAQWANWARGEVRD